jgi:hypothetical protein
MRKQNLKVFLMIVVGILMLPSYWESSTILSNVTIIIGYIIAVPVVLLDKECVSLGKALLVIIFVGLIWKIFFSGQWLEYYNW